MPAFPPKSDVYIVDLLASLPTGVRDASIGSVGATNAVYQYDNPTNTWNVIGGSGVLLSILDTNSVDLDLPMPSTLTATVRLSSDAADVGFTIVPIDIRAGASKGLRAQVSNAAIVSAFTFNDTNSIDLTNTTGVVTADLRLSTNVADVGYTIITNDIEAAVSLGLRSQILNTSITSLFSVTDTNSFDFTYTAGNITGNVRISNNAADALNTIVPINIESAGTVGLRAQILNSNITSLFSVVDTNSIDFTYTAGAITGSVRISSNAADAGYTVVPIDIESAASVGLRAQVLNTAIRALLSNTAPITYNNTTGVIGITQSGVATDGYLSSTDWNTFNNKQTAITIGALGAGNANGLSLSAGTLTLHAATATQPGAVSIAAQTLAGDKTFSGFVAARDYRLLNTGGTFYVLLNSPGALGANYTLTLPSDGGTNGYILTTNGSGVTSWTAPANDVQLLSGSSGSATTGTVTFSTNTDAFKFLIEFSTERSVIECCTSYTAADVSVASDIGGYFLFSDAGTGVYIFKSASSNVVSIKNRLGGTRTIKVTVLSNGVATLSAFA